MRPWVGKFAGCEIINFVILHDRVGKLVEIIFDGKRYLTLVVNETAFSDAVLTVMEENLWLSRNLDPHYFDAHKKIVKNVKLHRMKICAAEPIISLPLGDNLVTISQTIGNLNVSFPVSKFVEEALRHFEENPVISLCDTDERQKKFEEKWQKMLSELEDPN